MIEQFKALGRSVQGEMNKTEALHAQDLEMLKRAGDLRDYRFESVTLILGDDVRYTPDFLVMRADRTLHFHEVKGGFITDDARVKLRTAARLFPMFTFWLYQYTKKDGWRVVEIGT